MTDKQGVLEWYIGTSPPLGGLSLFYFFKVFINVEPEHFA